MSVTVTPTLCFIYVACNKRNVRSTHCRQLCSRADESHRDHPLFFLLIWVSTHSNQRILPQGKKHQLSLQMATYLMNRPGTPSICTLRVWPFTLLAPPPQQYQLKRPQSSPDPLSRLFPRGSMKPYA